MIAERYAAELRWLHQAGRAFAAAHPESARLLAEPGRDPDVERLLEGVAFLAAGHDERAAEAGAGLVQALLLALAPHLVRPWPATAVLRCSYVRGVRACAPVPPGALVESVPDAHGPCRFRFAWPAGPGWAEVAAAGLEAGDPPRLELRLAGTPPPGQAPPTTLRLHCHGEPALARTLRLALLASRRIVAVLPGGGEVPLRAVAAGLEPEEAVVPAEAGVPAGHLLLAQWAACPETLAFVELRGPPALGMPAGAGELRVVVELATPPGDLAGVTAGNLLAGCVPVANLWPAPAEPIAIDGGAREHLLRVSGQPAALPWAVRAVAGLGRGGRRRDWPHLLAGHAAAPRWQELRRAAPGGGPSELWLAHGDPDESAEGEVLAAELMVHDGARAAALGAGDIRVPTGAIPGGMTFANLGRPSPPHEPALRPDQARVLALRLRLAARGIAEVDALRGLLELDDPREPTAPVLAERLRRGEALRGLTRGPAAEPLDGTLVRALRHRLDIDEDAIGGAGAAHLLGSVLERTLAALAPLNTATSLTVHQARSGRDLAFAARAAGAAAAP